MNAGDLGIDRKGAPEPTYGFFDLVSLCGKQTGKVKRIEMSGITFEDGKAGGFRGSELALSEQSNGLSDLGRAGPLRRFHRDWKRSILRVET
jgi:hypothetical protein